MTFGPLPPNGFPSPSGGVTTNQHGRFKFLVIMAISQIILRIFINSLINYLQNVDDKIYVKIEGFSKFALEDFFYIELYISYLLYLCILRSKLSSGVVTIRFLNMYIST